VYPPRWHRAGLFFISSIVHQPVYTAREILHKKIAVVHQLVYDSNMVNGEQMRRKRESLGLTMQEAAERAGFTSRQQWYNVEAGFRSNVTPTTLMAIARALGCSIEDLLKKPEKKKAKK